jgi:CBS domain containing-hemolysin-like protein
VVHEGRVVVRGDVLDDTIADRFGVDVTIPDIDTVGGLVWHALGRLPEVGDVAVLEPAGLRVRVDEMEGREVRWVSFDVPEGPS